MPSKANLSGAGRAAVWLGLLGDLDLPKKDVTRLSTGWGPIVS